MLCRPLFLLFHPCLRRPRRNGRVRTLWTRTGLVAMQVGACPEFGNVSSPRHQWQRFVPTKASNMNEELKDRLLLALAYRQARGSHLANHLERDRSPRSTTLPEISLIADSAELGPSSSPPCGLQRAIALIMTVNRHGILSPPVAFPPPLTMIQVSRTTVNLPSTCVAKAESRHRMQSLPPLGQHHGHLWIVSISE